MNRGLALVLALAACQAAPITATCTPPPTAEQPWCDGPAITAGPDDPEPRRRLEAGIAAYGSRVAVIGGFSTSVHEGLAIIRELLVLDTLTATWARVLPDAPVAWTHANLASSGGTLYLLGGLEAPGFTARGEAFALDLGAPAWRALAAMPAGLERGAAAVVAAPPHIYLLGGATSGGATASCLEYNVQTAAWTSLPELPVARSHAAAMRRPDGTLIVAGGISDAGLPLGDVWSLAPRADAWHPREPMPTRRGGCAHGVAAGQLVCAGGEAGSSVLSVVESYDPVADRWAARPAMPAPRAGVQGAVVGQRLYVPGGAETRAFEPTDTVLVLSLLDALR